MDELGNSLLTQHQELWSLALALALGAVMGLQKGWKEREQESGQRIAGIRTYTLVGLAGGLLGLIGQALSHWLVGIGFICFSGIAASFYFHRSRETGDISITGLVGLLLTYLFGVSAVVLDASVAASATVVTAIIMDNKASIHRLLSKMEQHELEATLKLLLITVVLLPILPDQGYGPNQSINPYEIWWLVVLVASISFVGHMAIRIGGPAKGILFSGIFAGLSSSTAITLHFSRLSKHDTGLSPLLGAGILAACGTMFPRILLFCSLLNPELLKQLWLAMVVMGVTLYLPACWLWLKHRHYNPPQGPKLSQHPLDIKYALVFGGVLALIMLLGNWLKDMLGDSGIYLLSATSGITDVDAITLSLAKMTSAELLASTAAIGIVIASIANNLVKASLAVIFGNKSLRYYVTLPLVIAVAVGLVTQWLFSTA